VNGGKPSTADSMKMDGMAGRPPQQSRPLADSSAHTVLSVVLGRLGSGDVVAFHID